jgi:subtilisin family serine protease
MPKLNRWASGLILFALAAGATASADTQMAALLNRASVSDGVDAPSPAKSAPVNNSSISGSHGSDAANRDEHPNRAKGSRKSTQETATANLFIVLFKEEALASYSGGRSGLETPPRRLDDRGVSRLDSRTAEARSYVAYLESVQRASEQQIASVLGRPVQVRTRMQHALNAVIIELNPSEAERVAKMSNVKLVEPYREYELDTDLGPALIGAPPIWNGTNVGATASYKGEGMVVGVIDSGINFGSPSFAAAAPVDGYVHVNPLGTGNFLGTCAAGGVDAGRCNDKLIGGYDFVCAAPANLCGTANVREEPGFGDTNGHGTHTASTAAGNTRDVIYRGVPLTISGVAPRANIIAYDACYTNTSTGQGLCPNVSTLEAVNQAIADNIVDVINYSIGGGVDPWSEAVSLAFLGATNAGVFVSTSAGNSGPGPNTTGHHEPWVSASAASQTGRNGFGTALTVTGPAPVPANLAPVIVNEGTGGVALAATIPGTTRLTISAGINTASDGCAAYPANTFAGAIAVVRRGTCSFSIKANNAAAAGAIAMVLANNAAGVILPNVPGTTIPVFSVTQAEGDALRSFGQANPTTATAQIAFPPSPVANTVDALAAFSSRGPASTYNLIKPDITAPGVSILAAYAGTTISGSENLVELLSGTSMASPHQAGSAALIRQARPTWTPLEIKSALAMTATPQVLLEDQTSPANPFARGSGRLRVDRAVNAGLVLNEVDANFQAADPALGGAASSLNLPSMANRSCFPTCKFTRIFRSTKSSSASWQFDLQGLTGTVSPTSATVAAGATQTVTITIDTSALPTNGSANFGNLEIREALSGGGFDPLATLNLPIMVAVQPPAISVPSSISATVAATKLTTAEFKVGNVGGSTLNYTLSNTGSGETAVANSDNTGISSGFRSVTYTDPVTAANNGQYAADDFVLAENTAITSLSTLGFVVSGGSLASTAVNLTWSIYPDAAGLPAGNPSSAPGAATWTYTATPTATGVTTTSGSIVLDLVAAGQNVSLAPGRYWLVVNTRSSFANRWAHFGSNQTNGNTGFATINVSTAGAGAWAASTAFPGLSVRVVGRIACGAPWLRTAFPASGSLLQNLFRDTSLFATAGALTPGAYRANVCVNSNDLVTPAVAVPVNLTVTQ